MGQPRLAVYSDFICPFCFIGKVQVERLQRAYPGLAVEWREFELYPRGVVASDPRYLERVRDNVARLATDYRIDMRPEVVGGVSGGSRLPLAGLAFARERGRADAYRDAVFRAHWVDGLDIGDPQVLDEIAGRLKLPRRGFRAALDDDKYHRHVDDAMDAAFEQGIDGVPTFVYGDRKLAGAVPLQQLQALVDGA